jgi:2-keto-4-pentenoate hydratase/2-oxohepta-3-ene-1,7-dioic acid hydratase in catechol pathway
LKLGRYATNSAIFLGEVGDASVRDLAEGPPNSDLLGHYLAFGRTAPGIERSRADIRLLSPLTKPSKLLCVGLNYHDHCLETGSPIPDHPVLFNKFPSSIVGPWDPITFRRSVTSRVDFEVELAVVIGRQCRRVREEDAYDCVLGYTIANDVSARDLQFIDTQWMFGKSLDTFCPLGPVIVTHDEIGDPQALKLRCSVNGTTYQDSNTSEMIFAVPTLLAYISRGITLEAGDVILTGTPAGVGFTRKPPIYLQDRDIVKVEIDGIGSLENPVTEIDESISGAHSP